MPSSKKKGNCYPCMVIPYEHRDYTLMLKRAAKNYCQRILGVGEHDPLTHKQFMEAIIVCKSTLNALGFKEPK